MDALSYCQKLKVFMLAVFATGLTLGGCQQSVDRFQPVREAMEQALAADTVDQFSRSVEQVDILMPYQQDEDTAVDVERIHAIKDAKLILLGVEGLWKLESAGVSDLQFDQGQAFVETEPQKLDEAAKANAADLMALSSIVLKEHGLIDREFSGQVNLGDARQTLVAKARGVFSDAFPSE